MSRLDDAESGQTWVCPTCGKRAKNPDLFLSATCAVRSVLCVEDQPEIQPLRAVFSCEVPTP